jgi:hypothetical protein
MLRRLTRLNIRGRKIGKSRRIEVAGCVRPRECGQLELKSGQ